MDVYRRRLLSILITTSLVVCLMLVNPPIHISAFANPDASYEGVIVECLRIKVPAQTRKAWLEVERISWEPWLAKQEGFLSRDMFWDPKLEEATVLIRWSSRNAWKCISVEEVEAVQVRFENMARQATGQQMGNPFPLLYEGELLPL